MSIERQFCGESLFLSELALGSLDDDLLSDDNNGGNDYDERGIDVDGTLIYPSKGMEGNYYLLS